MLTNLWQSISNGLYYSADGIRKGPGSAVPVQLTQGRPAALANHHTLQVSAFVRGKEWA